MTTTEALNTETIPMLGFALDAWDAGMAVLRVKADSTKAPMGLWKHYVETGGRPTRNEVGGWFRTDHPGIGVLTGTPSGGLEMFEFEGRAVEDGMLGQFIEDCYDNGLGDLIDRIRVGWSEITPSGGVHFYYRWEPEDGVRPGNVKLATRPHPDEPGQIQTLVETRGERGFSVIAPSYGPVSDPPGLAWEIAQGGPASVATITEREREGLFQLARRFHVEPERKEAPARERLHRPIVGEGWIDEAMAKLDERSWASVLGDYGWTYSHTRGAVDYWTRPGKDFGISATTNSKGSDRLIVFSSSTPFEPWTGVGRAPSYDRLDVVAVYDHAGDRVAAAKALYPEVRDAWKERKEEERLAAVINMPPRPTAPPPNEPPPPTSDGTEEPDGPTFSTGRPCTDLGNAERLIDLHGPDLLYFAAQGEWLVWDGVRWEIDVRLRHRRLAAEAVRTIYTEAGRAETKDEKKDLIRHAMASESAGRISAMVKLSEPYLAITEHDLDTDVWLLNTPNGTLNLRTGQLEPHDRNDRITKVTKVPYNPDAKCPRWDQFLLEIMGGDQAMVDYLQRGVGYSLAGDDSEQAMMLAVGDGANGKSTFVNTLADVLGDYAGTCGKDVIAAGQRSSAGAANEELVNLRGLRFVSATETEQGQPLAEAQIKRITGGETITARKLFGHNITFRPTFTLWLSTNHLPKITGTDDGIWRRIKVVPFRVKFPAGSADPHLREKLMAEAEGILAWAVRGAQLWIEQGLQTPDVVNEATRSYREESDHLGQFMSEECETDPEFKDLQKSLYARYYQWCADEGGATPLSSLEFKRALVRKGFTVQRAYVNGAQGNAVLGMRLRSR